MYKDIHGIPKITVTDMLKTFIFYILQCVHMLKAIKTNPYVTDGKILIY